MLMSTSRRAVRPHLGQALQLQYSHLGWVAPKWGLPGPWGQGRGHKSPRVSVVVNGHADEFEGRRSLFRRGGVDGEGETCGHF